MPIKIWISELLSQSTKYERYVSQYRYVICIAQFYAMRWCLSFVQCADAHEFQIGFFKSRIFQEWRFSKQKFSFTEFLSCQHWKWPSKGITWIQLSCQRKNSRGVTSKFWIMNVSEYWLISAPGERTCSETWDRLNQVRFLNASTK